MNNNPIPEKKEKLISNILMSDTNANKLTINFIYDNQKLIKINTINHRDNENNDIRIIYEGSKIVKVEDDGALFHFNYDNNGKLKSLYCPSLPPYPDKSASYDLFYDSNNNIIKIVSMQPYNTVITNDFNYVDGKISNYLITNNKNSYSEFYSFSFDNSSSPIKNLPIEIQLYLGIGYEGKFSMRNEVFQNIGNNNIISYSVTYNYTGVQNTNGNYFYSYDKDNYAIKSMWKNGNYTMNVEYIYK